MCMCAELKYLPEVVGLLTAVTDLRLHDNFIEEIPKGDVPICCECHLQHAPTLARLDSLRLHVLIPYVCTS
jgi:hypothetical protein